MSALALIGHPTAQNAAAPQLTTQQQHVLNYLRVFFRLNDSLPSGKTIAHAFGYASANAAGEMLLKLAAKRVIEKNEVGGYRFARPSLTTTGDTPHG